MAKVIAQLDTFAKGTAGRHVEEELQSIRGNLSRLGAHALNDDADIAAAEKQLKGLRKHLAAAIARAEAAQLAAQVGQQQAALVQLDREAATIRLLSRRFDPEGLRKIDAQVKVVESLLQQQKLDQAQVEMTRLQESLARHRAQVERQQDRWNSLQEEATSAVATVQERVASLQADQVVQRWRAAELEELGRRVTQLEGSLSAGRFVQIHQECKSLMTGADKLVAAAEDEQRLQDQRDYVAKSLVESLAELGFWVQQFPAEQASADATIRASRADGRAITVSVPLEGSLRWTAEGFPMEVFAGSDGQPARGCGGLAEQIEAVKGCLEKHGVETGELLWKGKDPNRPGTTAKRLPRSNAHTAQRTRRAST
jgi:chromosome segregation ATPase